MLVIINLIILGVLGLRQEEGKKAIRESIMNEIRGKKSIEAALTTESMTKKEKEDFILHQEHKIEMERFSKAMQSFNIQIEESKKKLEENFILLNEANKKLEEYTRSIELKLSEEIGLAKQKIDDLDKLGKSSAVSIEEMNKRFEGLGSDIKNKFSIESSRSEALNNEIKNLKNELADLNKSLSVIKTGLEDLISDQPVGP